MPAPPFSTLVLREAQRLLRFERDRSASAANALNAWLGDIHQLLCRARRLDLPAAARLLGIQELCANEGLSFSEACVGRTPPWQLPERLLQAEPASLPAHPLIDMPWWLAQLDTTARPANALDAISRLLLDAPRRWAALPTLVDRLPPTGAPLAVCLHLYYPEMWPEFREALQSLPRPWDLFVTVPRFAATPVLQRIAADVPGVRFVPLPNRGRDVLPWLHLLRIGAFTEYSWVCKLHTKKSPHMAQGQEWRLSLLQGLLGVRSSRADLIERLDAIPGAGVVGPASALLSVGDKRFLGRGEKAMRQTRRVLGWSDAVSSSPYFAGTMFWFKPSALSGMGKLAEKPDRFPIEAGQTDGTMAHATERLVGECATRNGFLVESLP